MPAAPVAPVECHSYSFFGYGCFVEGIVYLIVGAFFFVFLLYLFRWYRRLGKNTGEVADT